MGAEFRICRESSGNLFHNNMKVLNSDEHVQMVQKVNGMCFYHNEKLAMNESFT